VGSSQSLSLCCQLFVFLNLCYENMYLCMVSPGQKRLEFLPLSKHGFLFALNIFCSQGGGILFLGQGRRRAA